MSHVRDREQRAASLRLIVLISQKLEEIEDHVTEMVKHLKIHGPHSEAEAEFIELGQVVTRCQAQLDELIP